MPYRIRVPGLLGLIVMVRDYPQHPHSAVAARLIEMKKNSIEIIF
jgi:hypothetical protein